MDGNDTQVEAHVVVNPVPTVAYIVTRVDPQTGLIRDTEFLKDQDGTYLVFRSRARAQKAGYLKFGARAALAVVGMGAEKLALFGAENPHRFVS